MTDFAVHNIRGQVVESRHRVSLAVVDADGSLVAHAGNPELVTFMRSAAKPFQALPLVADGAADRYEITAEELALACASHNSERYQVDIVRAWLARIGCTEHDLACGPHPPLVRDYALPCAKDATDAIELASPSRLASNCSGKHTGMLALARHHGWEMADYHRPEHPVQRRVKRELARWCHVQEDVIREATDGCGVMTFALSLAVMAEGFACLVTSRERPARVIVDAMCSHPDLVAGHRRLCTVLMRAYPRQIVTKVGAEGVYVAGVVDRGLGLALKVEDGHGKAAMVAVVAALEQLGVEPAPSSQLPNAVELPIRNTRKETVGCIRAVGKLTFI
jgi:L-asparaginase II